MDRVFRICRLLLVLALLLIVSPLDTVRLIYKYFRPSREGVPSKDGTYRIYDYFSPTKPIKDFADRNQWKEEIRKRVGNMMIVKWNHYTSPLHAIDNVNNTIPKFVKYLFVELVYDRI